MQDCIELGTVAFAIHPIIPFPFIQSDRQNEKETENREKEQGREHDESQGKSEHR